jgi:CAAX protease family protein
LRADMGQTAALEAGRIPPLGLGSSTALFGTGAVLLLLTTHVVLPALRGRTQAEPVLLWFGAATVCLFAPLISIAAWLLYRESHAVRSRRWVERLRLGPMASEDWAWTVGGVAAVGLLSASLVAALRALRSDAGLHPPFMAIEPLTPGRYWILAAWLPFFFLNILGEEFLWRGVVLPRQEAALGSRAWLANGMGWLFFHIALPWQVLVTLAPTTLILPYVVQRRGNTWIGVLIHAGLNGPGFLALAFGLT